MAKSFQPVVVSRSYKDYNSAGPVKVLAALNIFLTKIVWFIFQYYINSRHRPYFLNDFQPSFLLPC